MPLERLNRCQSTEYQTSSLLVQLLIIVIRLTIHTVLR